MPKPVNSPASMRMRIWITAIMAANILTRLLNHCSIFWGPPIHIVVKAKRLQQADGKMYAINPPGWNTARSMYTARTRAKIMYVLREVVFPLLIRVKAFTFGICNSSTRPLFYLSVPKDHKKGGNGDVLACVGFFFMVMVHSIVLRLCES